MYSTRHVLAVVVDVVPGRGGVAGELKWLKTDSPHQTRWVGQGGLSLQPPYTGLSTVSVDNQNPMTTWVRGGGHFRNDTAS